MRQYVPFLSRLLLVSGTFAFALVSCNPISADDVSSREIFLDLVGDSLPTYQETVETLAHETGRSQLALSSDQDHLSFSIEKSSINDVLRAGVYFHPCKHPVIGQNSR